MHEIEEFVELLRRNIQHYLRPLIAGSAVWFLITLIAGLKHWTGTGEGMIAILLFAPFFIAWILPEIIAILGIGSADPGTRTYVEGFTGALGVPYVLAHIFALAMLLGDWRGHGFALVVMLSAIVAALGLQASWFGGAKWTKFVTKLLLPTILLCGLTAVSTERVEELFMTVGKIARIVNPRDIFLRAKNWATWAYTQDEKSAIETETQAKEAAARAAREADRLETTSGAAALAARLDMRNTVRERQLRAWAEGGYVGPMPTPDSPRPTPEPVPGVAAPAGVPTTGWYYENQGGSGIKTARVTLCQLDDDPETATYSCVETGDPAKDTWFQSQQRVRIPGGGQREMLVRWKLVAKGMTSGHSCDVGECHIPAKRSGIRNVMMTSPDLWSGEIFDDAGRGWITFTVQKRLTQ